MRPILIWGLLAGWLSMSCQGGSEAEPGRGAEIGVPGVSGGTAGDVAEVECGTAESVVSSDGVRRLALLVGVGDYKADVVTDLKGPPNDVRLLRGILGSKAWQFPAQNICTLVNEEATTARFRATWKEWLLKELDRGGKSVVVFYMSSHGSQVRDRSGDEADNYDETLLFHDSRYQGIRDIDDDEFNGMLAQAYEKADSMTVILDACNSGSSTRGLDQAKFQARMEPAEDDALAAANKVATGDGSEGWSPKSMPELVSVSAALDGTVAYERNGSGIMTGALAEVLASAEEPMTWEQVRNRITKQVSAKSTQTPLVQGNLNRFVFGLDKIERPMAWTVTKVKGSRYELEGLPTAGWSEGALLAVFDGNETNLKVGATDKGLIVLDEITGFSAVARNYEGRKVDVKEGDLVRLVQPGRDALALQVHLKPESAPGGLPASFAADLRKILDEDPIANQVVDITDGSGFLVGLSDDGKRVQLIGPEGRVRASFPMAAKVDLDPLRCKLVSLATQQALLAMHSEESPYLSVRAVPASDEPGACASGEWRQAHPGQIQKIPPCRHWRFEVSLDEKAPHPMIVGGAILTSQGDIYGFPMDGRKVQLNPGKSALFPSSYLRPTAPYHLQDQIVVFGMQPGHEVPWNQFTQCHMPRSAPSGAFDGWFRSMLKGTRGAPPPSSSEALAFTSAVLTVEVQANPLYQPPPPGIDPTGTERFHIDGFEVGPYFTDIRASALNKLLEKAAATTSDKAKGSAPAIRDLFQGAGLPFPDGELSLSTLADRKGPMKAHFSDCIDDDKRAGDVVVYTDDADHGQALMVIDDARRYAWGSYSWSEEATDKGVGFQYRKDHTDWERLGASNTRIAACWRHNRLAAQFDKVGGRPGSGATDPCKACYAKQ